MRTCLAYQTTWQALDSRGQINKSDRDIKCGYALRVSHTKALTNKLFLFVKYKWFEITQIARPYIV